MLFIVSPDIRQIITAGTRAKEQLRVSSPDSAVPLSDWRNRLSGAMCTLREICHYPRDTPILPGQTPRLPRSTHREQQLQAGFALPRTLTLAFSFQGNVCLVSMLSTKENSSPPALRLICTMSSCMCTQIHPQPGSGRWRDWAGTGTDTGGVTGLAPAQTRVCRVWAPRPRSPQSASSSTASCLL